MWRCCIRRVGIASRDLDPDICAFGRAVQVGADPTACFHTILIEIATCESNTSNTTTPHKILYHLHDGLNWEFSGSQDGQLVFLR